MNIKSLDYLVCPKCRDSFILQNEKIENNKIKNGDLLCSSCNKKYQIIDFIPRFVDSELYVSSFGDEWNIYKNVKNSKSQISKDEMKNYLSLEKKDIENKFVKKEGLLSIWLYGYYWKRKIDNKEWLRKNIFSKLSSKQLKTFSFIAANFLYYLHLIPIIGDGLRERFPITMDKNKEVRELNTFDMYSLSYINYHYLDEVYYWFKECGFSEIEPSRYMLGMKGIKC